MELFVDTWEGQGDIQEDVLCANGVKAVITRLNDMNGGHHMDEYFLTQWEQTKNMLRAIYFVYNPWASAQANFDWLISHMPADAKALAIDIEVRYDGITPAKYAQDVRIFYDLCKAKWRTVIYTGEWFLPYLSSWPTDAPYWWAQYPLSLYPPTAQFWTWNDLRTVLANYSGPLNASRCPGRILMWQFTGDRLILPGSSNKMDVNAYMGSASEMEAWFGWAVIPPPTVDEIYNTHPGITVHKIVRFGCPVFVHIIDPKRVKIWVTGTDNKFRNVVQTATRYSASVVTNGGGWPYGSTYANEIWKSKGLLLQSTAKDNRPWVGFTRYGEVVFGQGIPSSDVLDVVGYDRYLGQNGVFNSRYLYDTVKDARTFSGRSRSGKFVLCCAEGDDYDNYGLTFKEEWDILAEFDCDIGGNHDGGSSSGVVNKALGEGSLTKPSDPELAYVINAIVANAESGMVPMNEYRKLVGVNQGAQGDLNQTAIWIATNSAGGAQWFVTLNQADIDLIWKVNGITSKDDPKWRWACGQLGKAYYQPTDADPVRWPYVVICSALDGSKINQVHCIGYGQGFYQIELIPVMFGNITPATHPWLFHRCIAQSSDTPQGIFWMPLFSPVGRRHSTGSEGALLPYQFVDGKITEGTVPFETKITGVPNVILGPQKLNIRESASLYNPGKIGFFNVGSIVEVLEVASNGDGKFGRVTSKYWICLYNVVKNQWYVSWRG